MQFTKSQKEAIDHRKGNLQLIACAGSGKTEVVARRVAKLLSGGVIPANIIAFTFTDKAAAELKERITQRCREEVGDITGLADMYVGTIHAFCLDLLKGEVPKFLKYEVLNEVQQVLFVDRYSRASGLTTTTKLDGKSLRRYVDTARYIDALEILREARLDNTKLMGISVVEGLAKYRGLLQEKPYLDYSAIMEEALKSLLSDHALQKRLADRVKHVIVDEYQDVNPIQESIVRKLHELGAEVCVVGDDDQTVYQWRGSDVQNILDFAKNYSGVRKVPLQENFRSSQGIVETARDFIKKNDPNRLAKAMISTNAQPYDSGDIISLSFDDPEGEAAFIAARVKELRGVAFKDGDKMRGLSYSDMAVLLRSVRYNGDPIVHAFQTAGIPFVVGGMNHLFDTPEAHAARVLFYFLQGRPAYDKASVIQAWTEADLGLDQQNLARTVEAAEGVRVSLSAPDVKKAGKYYLQRQYLDFLEKIELREENVPRNRGEVVFYNLGKFSQLISDFETIHFHTPPTDKYEAFGGFLEYGADGAYPEGWQDNQYANPDAVRIMTVHQAKGMQWPVVFVPALLRNRFPAAKSKGASVWHLLPRESVIGQRRYEGSIEDERRLFYVAMTRSQKFLFMTWAPVAGNQLYTKKSEFWDNVLASKWVKRKLVPFSSRPHLVPEPRPGISNVVFSFSDVKYFFECPYQFKLRILYGFNAPIHEGLGYGKSLHDALAEVHQRAINRDYPTGKDVTQLVATHLHLPYAYRDLKATLEKNATRILHDYLAKNGADFDKIEFSEKKIEMNLGDGVSVNGRIDLVRRLDTNETSIVDLKTSDRVQAEEVTETQLHIYALGYQELTGKRADYVETYELDDGTRKPRAVDDDFIEDVRKAVKTAADALRRGVLPPKASAKTCGTCDFRRMCSAGCSVAAQPARRK